MFRLSVTKRFWMDGYLLSAVQGGASLFVDPVAQPYAFYAVVSFFMRGVSSVFSIWGDRHVALTATAMPDLHVAHKNYLALHEHPQACYWDKQVAIKLLNSERERIFRRFGTSSMWLNVPPLCAAVSSCYLASLAGSVLPPSLLSPLLIEMGSIRFDVCPSIAALTTSINGYFFLQRRRGFSIMMDAQTDRLRKVGSVVLVVAWALASFGLTAAAANMSSVWLGMSLCGLVRTCVVSTAITKHLLQIPQYPLEHGTYGSVSTLEGHKYVLEVKQLAEDPEAKSRWETTKSVIDVECDTRIYKMLNQLGIIGNNNEMEERREQLDRRIMKLRDAGDKYTEGVSAAPADSTTK